MMNTVQEKTLQLMVGCTASLVDRQTQMAALAYSKGKGIETETRALILEKRLYWLNWLAMTQRRWQRETRNPNKARHHDSIEIREKYVRC
jgi:hypothetical protein